MEKRDGQADILRGILIILMVMGHVRFGSSFDKYIHMFHMPAWFILAGWFSQGKNRSFAGFLRRKTVKLLLPYIICGIVHYPLWIILVRKNSGDLLTPLKSLFWINTNQNLPIANALWFLTSLFFAELIFEVIRRISRSGYLMYALCAAAAVAGCVMPSVVSFRLPWGMDTALVGCGLMALGYGASANRESRTVKRLLNMPLPVWAVGMVCNIALCFVNGSVNMRTGSYGIIPLTWLNMAFATLLFWNLAGYIQKWGCRLAAFDRIVLRLEAAGRNSIVYLCWNQLAILITGLLLSNTALAKLPLFIYRPIALFLVLFFLYGAEQMYAHGKQRRAGKAQTDKTQKKKRAGTVVIYLLLASVIVAGCALMKKQAAKKAVNSISVSVPKISADTRLEEYTEADILKAVLYDNVRYLADDLWNSPNIYAYSSSSYISRAKEPNMLTGFLIQKSLESFREWEKRDSLYVANSREGVSREQAIRPWAHTCFVMANAIRFGLAKDREEELQKKASLLIQALAKSHMSNSLMGWGNSWQSAEWAENIGYAAWLLWDILPQEGQYNVYKMVTYEADRFLDYQIPYYRDRSGTIVYEGDTKAEENAWNSRILALAACMFPEEPNREIWETRMKELLIASGAAPSDVNSEETVDGFLLRDVLNGSNINEDGTLVNHKRIHIDYIVTTMEGMLDTAIIYSLSGRDIPSSATFGFERMYNALVNVDLGVYDAEKAGHHFFERNGDAVSGAVNMPGENDWGGYWYPEYYLADTAVDLMNLDSNLDDNLKAEKWAKAHLRELASMSMREENGKKRGQFFAEGENNFVSGEMYQMHNLSKAYLLRLLMQEGQLNFGQK